MVELEFPLTQGELEAAEERAFRRLARNVRLPGFRKGKVPRKIFDQTYGPAAVTTEAVEEVVPQAYAKAIREHDLQPVDRPKFEVVEENDGRPIRMKAIVEVRPAIELHRYKGLAVSRPSLAVTDADVEQSLEALAKERATLVPVDRAARLGDVTTIDYEGTVDGSPFAGGRGEGEVVELSEGRFVPGFATGIAGMTVGETKQVEAEFPPGYPSAELAGKQALFMVTLRELKEPELPPLDDDFAKAISENQTVTQLREDIRRRLEAVAAGRGRRFVGNAVMTQLLATHDFPLPPSLVENEVSQLVEEASQTAQAVEKSEAELRDAHRAEAESRVKAGLLVQAIANAENIVATPADVTAELEALARRYGQPVARIRKALGNNLLSLMDGIVRNKTLDLLVDNAVVSIDQETPGAAS
jgi:trigger factor